MAGIVLRGMTWEHRRAVEPLIRTMPRFRDSNPGIEIAWSARPLSGFEFTPVADLARDYDLLVFDHPFAGDVAAGGYLVPLDELLDERASSAFVGPSLDSYRYAWHLWAVPIDAACQVAVSRPDLLARVGRPAPSIWSEVIELGRLARRNGRWLAIALKGVHSLMTFFTLCANLGRPCATEPTAQLIDTETAAEALAALHQLLDLCPPDVLDWNSIALHDAMVVRDDLVFCPAVYCYATYAEADQRRSLRFHDFPGPRGLRGSTIGGTGLGVSAHCKNPEAALAYARFAAELDTQFTFARHHGQPARREVWEDDAVNERFGGCYRATLATIDAAWVRPRYKGYLCLQAKGGELVEQHLRGEISESHLISQLNGLHAAAAR
jgi:multiple sugar transport system substrate-binding protein